jgi:hypothetical protein
MATPWTDEEKQSVIERYEEANPTPETSMEIVKEIAEDINKSPNGVRMILSAAKVYVSKGPSVSNAKASGPGRVSKQDSQDALTAAIEAAGQEASEEIISKLTGKAAVYLTTLINAINE